MELLITLSVDLFITAIAYLIVPIIFIVRGKPLTLSQIKKIVVINGICVWLIFTIIRIEQGIDGTSFAVVLWSYIAYLVMKKKCLRSESDNESILEEPCTETLNVTQTPTKKPKRLITLLTILLTISLLGNIIQAIKDARSPDYILSDPPDYEEISEKTEFYDECIVFVIEGYGDYYFTYDEMMQITKYDEDFSFWAYNKELAIDLGYTAYYN